MQFKEWLELIEQGGAGVARGRPGATGQYAGFQANRAQLWGPSAHMPGAPGYDDPSRIQSPQSMLAPAFFTGIGQSFLRSTGLQPQAFPHWPAVPPALEEAPWRFERDDLTMPLVLPDLPEDQIERAKKKAARNERIYRKDPEQFWAMHRIPDLDDHQEVAVARDYTEKLLEKGLWNRLSDKGLLDSVVWEKWRDNADFDLKLKDGKPYLTVAVRYPKRKYQKD
jgi:hypothetical protein